MMYQGIDASVVNKFPGKLWKLVNSGNSDAIKWGMKGKTIVIDPLMFEKELLNQNESIFKTSNVSSFIRQLNLYGFKKITAFRQIVDDEPKKAEDGSEILEFYNEDFRKGCPELLVRLRRNVGIRRSREIAMQRQAHKEVIQAEVARLTAAGYQLTMPQITQLVESHLGPGSVIPITVYQPARPVRTEVINSMSVRPEAISPLSVRQEAINSLSARPESANSFYARPGIINTQSVRLETINPISIRPEAINPMPVRPETLNPMSARPEAIHNLSPIGAPAAPPVVPVSLYPSWFISSPGSTWTNTLTSSNNTTLMPYTHVLGGGDAYHYSPSGGYQTVQPASSSIMSQALVTPHGDTPTSLPHHYHMPSRTANYKLNVCNPNLACFNARKPVMSNCRETVCLAARPAPNTAVSEGNSQESDNIITLQPATKKFKPEIAS